MCASRRRLADDDPAAGRHGLCRRADERSDRLRGVGHRRVPGRHRRRSTRTHDDFVEAPVDRRHLGIRDDDADVPRRLSAVLHHGHTHRRAGGGDRHARPAHRRHPHGHDRARRANAGCRMAGPGRTHRRHHHPHARRPQPADAPEPRTRRDRLVLLSRAASPGSRIPGRHAWGCRSARPHRGTARLRRSAHNRGAGSRR